MRQNTIDILDTIKSTRSSNKTPPYKILLIFFVSLHMHANFEPVFSIEASVVDTAHTFRIFLTGSDTRNFEKPVSPFERLYAMYVSFLLKI